MKTLGIVCEYNPFHNGHKYHIEKSKELFGCDTVVCAMSGSLVQRGEVAIFDKWTRAENAVKFGADLVLEIPAFFCLQSGEKYAYGAVSVLNMLGSVDLLSFGSECGDIDFLTKLAFEKQKESYRISLLKFIKTGMSYPAASEAAIREIINPLGEERIFSPNDLLGIEYISALLSLNSSIKPVTVKRHLTNHNQEQAFDNFASATKIRKMLFQNEEIRDFLPYDPKGFEAFDEKNAESFILGYLRFMQKKSNCLGGEDGIFTHLAKCAKNATSLEEFYSLATSKRYTESRIKRVVKCAVLNIEKNSVLDYIRPLAFNSRGRELLKNSPAKDIIISKAADFKGKENSMFKYDVAATDFAYLCANNPKKRKSGADFYTSPVYVK